MPEYLAPGVYVEEVDSGPVPIEGVSTSTAGMVGLTQRGPAAGLPVLVTNFGEFTRRFGSFLPESFGDSRFLAYAVSGFFENRGERVYIKRVIGAGAAPSALDVLDGVVTRLQRDMSPNPTRARLASLRGISVGDNIEFRENVAGVAVTESRAVTAYNPLTNEVSWMAPLGRAFTQPGTAVVVRAPAGPATLRLTAVDPGRWGDDIRVSFEDTTPARSQLVPNLVIPIQPLNLNPAFAAAGPARNALNTDLNAGHGLVSGDVVEFSQGDTRERRTITVNANQITWNAGLRNDFSQAGSTIRVLTAARPGGAAPFEIRVPAAMTAGLQPGAVLELAGDGNREEVRIDAGWVAGSSPIVFANAFANSYLEGATLTPSGTSATLNALPANLTFPGGPVAGGPPGGATNVDLDPGHGLQAGDTVRFDDGVNPPEDRTLDAVNGDNIDWTPGGVLANAYNVAGATVRLLTAARAGTTNQLTVPAPFQAVISPGDSLRISAGGVTETVTVDPAWPPNTAPVLLSAPVANTWLEGATISSSGTAARPGTNAVRVQSARSFYPGGLIEIDNGSQRQYFTVDAINGDDLTLSGNVGNVRTGNLVRLAEFNLLVRYVNDADRVEQTELIDGLSMNPNSGSRYVVTAVNSRSRLIRAEDLAGPAVPLANPSTSDGLPQRLTGGSDGAAPPEEAFIGEDLGPGRRTGIQALADIDQISIIAAPGKSSQSIQNALITQCELLKDRFAVLDPPEGATVETVQVHRNQYDTKYAALYYPWVRVRDPLARAERNVPPSGHMIGIYARVDNTRGVHKAPANEVIRGILGLEQIVNKREQDILNPSPVNINVLRDFSADGRGRRVFGARCITSDTLWKYVNVRRLVIFIAESLQQGTDFAVFEPNDPRLWGRLTQSVTNFLTRVWKDGALFGATPQQAFFVRCDLTTMTTDDLENGRLIMLIGVAPVKPAEFVIIRITQVPAGSIVEEVA